jgi:hypothetical protein
MKIHFQIPFFRMKIHEPQYFFYTTLVFIDYDSRLMVMLYRKVVKRCTTSLDLSKIPLCDCRFIDVPIESCGKSSPLRVALQATAPDVLMILLRHGANPEPLDGGTSPILAVMDKLMEYSESGSYPYQFVSCLKILLLAIPFIELPYKVRKKNAISLKTESQSHSICSRCCLKQERKCF